MLQVYIFANIACNYYIFSFSILIYNSKIYDFDVQCCNLVKINNRKIINNPEFYWLFVCRFLAEWVNYLMEYIIIPC